MSYSDYQTLKEVTKNWQLHTKSLIYFYIFKKFIRVRFYCTVWKLQRCYLQPFQKNPALKT